MGQQTSSPWVKRRRQATLLEIRTTARQLLRKHGPTGVTVNAVAREMGMSGPAVYRYYVSHDALVEAIITDFYQELTSTMLAARDACPPEHPGRRLLMTCRAMRAWALDHPSEFSWMFASPVMSAARPDEESPGSGPASSSRASSSTSSWTCGSGPRIRCRPSRTWRPPSSGR